MKITNEQLDGVSKTPMYEWIVNRIKGHGQEYRHDYIYEVINSGCGSCIESDLVYTDDAVAFHDKFESEIWDKLETDAADFGHKSIIEFIATFNGIEHVSDLRYLKNTLVWYTYERAMQEIADLLELNL